MRIRTNNPILSKRRNEHSFDNILENMRSSPAFQRLNMIREIQIKNTIEWLTTTEDGYVVNHVAEQLGISTRKVAEMIVDHVV